MIKSGNLVPAFQKNIPLFFIVGVLFSAGGHSYAALPCDFLKTNGTIIKNNAGSGDTVQLCGVNIGGLQLMESWMSPLAGARDEWTARQTLTSRFGATTMWNLYTAYWDSFLQEDDFQKIANEGLNCVRLIMYYHNHMDERGNWRLKPDSTIDFSRLDWAVSTAAKYGIYTILDLHGVPGSQNGQDHSGQIGTANLYADTNWQNMAVKFWQGLASHFKGNAAVAGYDLMNEPSENFPAVSGPAVFRIHDKLYKAVRAVDPDHIIVIMLCWKWTDAPPPAFYGWQNVVYEVHNYSDPIDSSVKWANDCRNTYHVPYYIGEFTYSTSANYTSALTQFTRIGVCWSPWTYKVKTSGSSWGMYTGGGATPNLANETSSSIATKWGQWNTSTYCTRNAMVCNAIKSATALIKIRRFGDCVTSIQTTAATSQTTKYSQKVFKFALERFVVPKELIGSGGHCAVYDLTGKRIMSVDMKRLIDLSSAVKRARGVVIVQVK